PHPGPCHRLPRPQRPRALALRDVPLRRQGVAGSARSPHARAGRRHHPRCGRADRRVGRHQGVRPATNRKCQPLSQETYLVPPTTRPTVAKSSSLPRLSGCYSLRNSEITSAAGGGFDPTVIDSDNLATTDLHKNFRSVALNSASRIPSCIIDIYSCACSYAFGPFPNTARMLLHANAAENASAAPTNGHSYTDRLLTSITPDNDVFIRGENTFASAFNACPVQMAPTNVIFTHDGANSLTF